MEIFASILFIAVPLAALLLILRFIWWLLGGDSARKERNADSTLDELFDGDDRVTYTINLVSLKYETVVLGAERRGYSLEHQSGAQAGGSVQTLVFRRLERAEPDGSS